jgi:hypothetical protein
MIGDLQYRASGRERISNWLYFARACHAMLSIAASIHEGQCGLPDDWKAIRSKAIASGRELRQPPDLDSAKFSISTILWEWALHSNLRPVLYWNRQPTIQLTYWRETGLFDVLLLSLMLRICRADGLAVCGSCQQFFTPDARARRGEIRFCGVCRRDGSANRVSAQLYRARKRGERQKGSK